MIAHFGLQIAEFIPLSIIMFRNTEVRHKWLDG